MTHFDFTDPDGDQLIADPIPYQRSGRPGWLFSITHANGRGNQRSAWLPDHVAFDLARAIVPSIETEHALQVGHAEDLAPRVELTIGDMTITVEGGMADSPMDVTKALIRILKAADGDKDPMALNIVSTLCELLSCPPAAILAEFQRVVDEHSAGVETIEEQRSELSRRPTTVQLQQAERQTKDADRRHELLARQITDERKAMTAIAQQLRLVGLQDMSTQSPVEIARRIALLGEDNTRLRQQLADAGRLNDDAVIRELRQEVKASQVIIEQLDNGLQRERDLHRVARQQVAVMTARIGELERDLSKVRDAASSLRAEVDNKVRQLRVDAAAFEEWKRMRDAARGPLQAIRDVISQVPSSAQVVALSRAQADEIVGMIDVALEESA